MSESPEHCPLDWKGLPRGLGGEAVLQEAHRPPRRVVP